MWSLSALAFAISVSSALPVSRVGVMRKKLTDRLCDFVHTTPASTSRLALCARRYLLWRVNAVLLSQPTHHADTLTEQPSTINKARPAPAPAAKRTRTRTTSSISRRASTAVPAPARCAARASRSRTARTALAGRLTPSSRACARHVPPRRLWACLSACLIFCRGARPPERFMVSRGLMGSLKSRLEPGCPLVLITCGILVLWLFVQ